MLNKQPVGTAPGIYYDMSDEEYHADPSLSSSGIKKLLPAEEGDKPNPLEYWEESVLNPNREPLDTAALRYGRAYHTLVLQPQIFSNQFIVLPPVNDIKIDSEAWAELRDGEDGKDFILPESKTAKVVKYGGKKIVISQSDYADMCTMRDVLFRSPQISTLLNESDKEVAIFWRDEETGIMCRVKFDLLHPQFITDLKTIASSTSSKRKLRYECLDRKYPVSAAMYLEGLRVACENGWITENSHSQFALLFQGKNKPHTPRLVVINDNHIIKGHDYFRLGLEIYQENLEKYGTDRWSDDQCHAEYLFDEI
jgi:hypothetical protein